MKSIKRFSSRKVCHEMMESGILLVIHTLHTIPIFTEVKKNSKAAFLVSGFHSEYVFPAYLSVYFCLITSLP